MMVSRAVLLALSVLTAGLVGCGDGGVAAPPVEPPPVPEGWTAVTGLPQGRAFEVLHREGAALVAAGDRDLWRTMDGQTWTALPRLPAGVEIARLHSEGGRRFAGSYGGQGVYELPAGASVWQARSQGLDGTGARTVTQFAQRDRQLYAGTDGAAVFRLDLDASGPWVADRTGIPGQLSWNINALVAYQGRIIASGGGNGANYLHVRGAAEWREVFYDSAPAAEPRQVWHLFGLDAVLLAGGNRRLYRSVDAGETWLSVAQFNRLAAPVRFVDEGPRVYALAATAGEAQVLRSTDAGLNWTVALPALAGVQAYDLAVLGDRLYLAHQQGLWSTPLSRLQ